MYSLLYGLASAFCWGAGDFSGGLGTKRHNPYSVVMFSQILGGVLIMAIAYLFKEPLASTRDLIFGAVAGIGGAFGAVSLYRGLAHRRMGLVAPLASLVTAIITLIFAAITEGLPSIIQAIGFLVALVAVWLLSMEEGSMKTAWRDLLLPVAAGSGFAVFFIFISQVSQGTVFWPLVSSRVASVTLFALRFLALGLLSRSEGPVWPGRSGLLFILLVGVFDVGGNAFYALATQAGRLDVAAVLASLYPGFTVLFAWLVLKERLNPRQLVGVLAALMAVVLIAL